MYIQIIKFDSWVPYGLPPRCTFVVRSLLIISSRDCREADSRDTSPRHACLGEASRKIWLHDFAINNNGSSVPVIFISLLFSNQIMVGCGQVAMVYSSQADLIADKVDRSLANKNPAIWMSRIFTLVNTIWITPLAFFSFHIIRLFRS